MTWTCEQTEARVSDYLDGLLHAEEWSAFNKHVNTCERCAPLVAGVAHALGGLYALEEVEPPPQLETAILTATIGARSSWDVWGWLRSFQSPRFVYSMASVVATIAILLTVSGFNWRKPKLADLAPATVYRKTNSAAHLAYAHGVKFVSDLRVVYEIQSRINETEPNPASREEIIPQSSPNKKEPGRTDNTNPSTPKQQNRANEIGRKMEVLASEIPVLASSLVERSMR